MTDKKWGHNELAHDLAEKFRADPSLMVFEDMPMGPSGSQRPDVYVLQKSYSKFLPRTYEVKVSKSDFRGDITEGKWQGYRQYSSAVIFAAPAGLITKDEVPAECGLILRHADVWRMAKKPTLNICQTLPHDVWMKLLIDGGERIAADKMRAFAPRCSPSGWMVEEKLRKRVGDEIAKLVAMAMQSGERLQRVITENEKKAAEIKAGTHQTLVWAKEAIERQEERVAAELRDLAVALGLARDATPSQLSTAVREAARRLASDRELTRLRKLFDRLEECLVDGLKPLPGEQLRLLEVAHG